MNDNNDGASAQLHQIQQRRIEQLNAQLRKQFAEYDMLMESTGVCIVKVKLEPGLPVEWCNEVAYRAIGYTKEEYEAQFGKDLHSYFRGNEEVLAELVKKADAALLEHRPRFQALVRFPSREGFFWAQYTGTFTDYDQTGRPSCVYGVFTDVTHIVEAREKLARADMENARLAAILDNIPVRRQHLRHRKGRRHLHHDQPPSRFAARHRWRQDDVSSLEQLLSYVHAEDRDWCRKALNDFLRGKTRLDVICRLRRAEPNSFSWMHVEGRIVKQSEDSAIAYLTYTDITALKETEKSLREAVFAAKLSVWEYDIPTHTIYVPDNEAGSEDCRKYNIPQVITDVPQSLAALIDERSMPDLLEMYRKVEAGENASCDMWYKREPGLEPRCERVSYTVEKDEQGRPSRAYAMGVNITAEKNAEEQYSRERSFLQDNRDFNLISKGHYNLTQNKVLEYTMQADKTPGGNYFGTHSNVTYDEAAAALFRMPCSEEDHAALVDAVDRQKLLQRHQEGHLTSRAQYRRLRKGDLPLWMSVEMRTYASPLTGDVECFSYTYDITDKVRNEQIMNHIAATEFDYVGLIFEQSGAFEFLQKSESIRFTDVNVRTPYADCCEYVRRNFVSADEIAQFDSAVALKNIIAGLNEGGRWSSTYHRTENGKILCKQMDYSWLDRDERVILAVRTDISSSYERDQQQLAQMSAAKLEADRANEAKSSFLSSMSHDMRTPLNAVLGFTDLALREQDAAVKMDYLKKVKSSGSLLLDLVNDTLEMSRIESGKFVLEPEASTGPRYGIR
jgi:PAS domain-containing protein